MQVQIPERTLTLPLIKEFFLEDKFLSPKELSLLSPEFVCGLNELQKEDYTPTQKKAIQLALWQFGQCKKEDLSGVANSWINEFAEMRILFFEVIKRIRLAKMEKKYGVTEFAIFMNVTLSDYGDFYKHKPRELNAN